MMSDVRMQVCVQVLHFGLHLTTACQGLLSSEHKIQKDGVTHHPGPVLHLELASSRYICLLVASVQLCGGFFVCFWYGLV